MIRCYYSHRNNKCLICNFFHANFSEYAFIYVLNILDCIDFIVSILHLNNFINALLLFIVLCRNLNKIFFDGLRSVILNDTLIASGYLKYIELILTPSQQ